MKTLIALLLCALCMPALAAQPLNCDHAGTQSELNICAADAKASADAELNRVYQQAMAQRVDRPGASKALRTAQRQWIKLRDADIDARFALEADEETLAVYGSMFSMLYSTAHVELTQARTLWLRTNFIGNDD